MAVINDCCIVLNNKPEPLDRWHNLAVMSVSFMCLISMLCISVSLLPCPWEIVLCWRKPVKEGDGEQFLWGCEESYQTVALRTLTFLLSLVFRYVRWKWFELFTNGSTAIERALFFDKSVSCWEVSTETTSDGCFLLCVKMHQIAIAGKRLFHPFHIIASSITNSAGFSVVFSVNWRQQFFDMSSYFFTLLGFSWQTRKSLIFSSLQYLWRAFPISMLCICTVLQQSWKGRAEKLQSTSDLIIQAA